MSNFTYISIYTDLNESRLPGKYRFYINLSHCSDLHSRSQTDARKVITSMQGAFFYFVKNGYEGAVAMQMRLSCHHSAVFWQQSACRHMKVTEHIHTAHENARERAMLTTSIQRHCLVLFLSDPTRTYNCLSSMSNFMCPIHERKGTR